MPKIEKKQNIISNVSSEFKFEWLSSNGLKLTPNMIVESQTTDQVNSGYNVAKEWKHENEFRNRVDINIDQKVHPSSVLDSQIYHPNKITYGV